MATTIVRVTLSQSPSLVDTEKIESLKIGEIERIQLSVKSSDVIAEGHEQIKREHYLKAKRSWLQSDSMLQNMERFFLSAMPNSGFSKSLKSMENVFNEDSSSSVELIQCISGQCYRCIVEHVLTCCFILLKGAVVSGVLTILQILS